MIAGEDVARSRLTSLPERLAHAVAVARLANTVAHLVRRGDDVVLVHAAWLLDIGYAPAVADTGVHALDGARWLDRRGHHRLACLVAHHTGAAYEAHARGLGTALSRFTRESSLVSDLLTWCDLSRGPTGQPIAPSHHLDLVIEQHRRDEAVARALAQARPALLATCERVDALVGRRRCTVTR